MSDGNYYEAEETIGYSEEEDDSNVRNFYSDDSNDYPEEQWDDYDEDDWGTRGDTIRLYGGSGSGFYTGLFAPLKRALESRNPLKDVIVKQTIGKGKQYHQLNILSTEYRGSFVEGIVLSLVSNSIGNDGVFQVFFGSDLIEVPCYTAKLFSPVLHACGDNQYHCSTTCESAASRESLSSLFKLEPVRINGDNCKFFVAIASELQMQDLLEICQELNQTLDLLDRFDVLADLQEEIEDVDSEIKAITTYDLIMGSCLSEDTDELLSLIHI